MALKIAICDDNPIDRQRLIALIKLENFDCECAAYESGEMLLWDFESGTHFDIIFLDIFMTGMTGVETAKQIRLADANTLLIFVSSSNEFYRESYDLYAFNYLIKPLTEEKTNEVLGRAREQLNQDSEQVIRIAFMGSLHTVRCNQLLYLSSKQHTVNFFVKNGETLKSYGKLDDFVAQLPADSFLRCHQSYIVNLNHVTAMTTGEFTIGDIRIPISRSYSGQARSQYRELLFRNF
jgi:DNA-binding LytR/AlgR family response regulator